MSQDATPPTAVPCDVPEGPVLFERYRIVGILGQGGMGTVFKGFHLNLKRFVAVKTLRLDRKHREDLIVRFLREMETIGQMDHPNVVRAYDAGERNGVFYLVMEHLDGCDLNKLTARNGPLQGADACELVRQAAVGLHHIHRTLVHRDVKPSNLMLTQGGQVKILDLGLARHRFAERDDQDLTPEGIAVGTYAYIAPEQAIGDAVDGRADLYSLGCTLFMLLTGRSPFSGPTFDSAAKQLHAHANVDPRTLETFAQLPAPLQPIIARMMAKAPLDRYRSGEEVAEALGPHCAGASILRLLEFSDPAAGLLLQPFPPEIGLLTQEPSRTPPANGTANGAAVRSAAGSAGEAQTTAPESQAQAKPERPRYWVAGAVAVAAALLLVVAIRPWGMPGDEDKPAATRKSVLALDALPAHTLHALLADAPPFPVGFEADDPRKWNWNPKTQQLEAKGWDMLVFPLGTCSRIRFRFEAGIAQAPWTGGAGIFWAYREDEALKKAAQPGVDFATFQMLMVDLRTGPVGEFKHLVRRGRGGLRFNKLGEIVRNVMYFDEEYLQLPLGEATLEFEAEGDRLAMVKMCGVQLLRLCSAETNRIFEKDGNKGALGVFALQGHAAAFGNVRFMAMSAK